MRRYLAIPIAVAAIPSSRRCLLRFIARLQPGRSTSALATGRELVASSAMSGKLRPVRRHPIEYRRHVKRDGSLAAMLSEFINWLFGHAIKAFHTMPEHARYDAAKSRHRAGRNRDVVSHATNSSIR
ncbi:hypothetical protein PUN4_520089 [Paraburkholderia unamae]|nr:hypothetical protein PUN4_520089 [Paraburkholderia unamae]